VQSNPPAPLRETSPPIYSSSTLLSGWALSQQRPPASTQIHSRLCPIQLRHHLTFSMRGLQPLAAKMARRRATKTKTKRRYRQNHKFVEDFEDPVLVLKRPTARQPVDWEEDGWDGDDTPVFTMQYKHSLKQLERYTKYPRPYKERLFVEKSVGLRDYLKYMNRILTTTARDTILLPGSSWGTEIGDIPICPALFEPDRYRRYNATHPRMRQSRRPPSAHV
jgi:hypothetical protein